MLKMFPSGACPEVKRLMNYERKKYKYYNSVILSDDGIPDIMKTI